MTDKNNNNILSSSSASSSEANVLFVPLSCYYEGQIEETFIESRLNTDSLLHVLGIKRPSLERIFTRVFKKALEDSCSYVAIDWQSNRVVAACLAVLNSGKTSSHRPLQVLNNQHIVQEISECDVLFHATKVAEIVYVVCEDSYSLKHVEETLVQMVMESAGRKGADYVTCASRNPGTQTLLADLGFRTLSVAAYLKFGESLEFLQKCQPSETNLKLQQNNKNNSHNNSNNNNGDYFLAKWMARRIKTPRSMTL